jgi:hypothetical protein
VFFTTEIEFFMIFPIPLIGSAKLLKYEITPVFGFFCTFTHEDIRKNGFVSLEPAGIGHARFEAELKDLPAAAIDFSITTTINKGGRRILILFILRSIATKQA